MAEDINKLISDLKKLQKEYTALTSKKAPLFDTSNVENTKNAIESISTSIEKAKEEALRLESGFNGVYGEIQGIVSELSSTESATKKVEKAFKGISSITRDLRNDQNGLYQLSLKDLKKRQEKLRDLDAEARYQADIVAQRYEGTKAQQTGLLYGKDNKILNEGALKVRAESLGITVKQLKNDAAILVGKEEEFKTLTDVNIELEKRIKKEKDVLETTGLLGTAAEGFSGGLRKAGLGALDAKLGIGEALEATKAMVKEGGGNVSKMEAGAHLAKQLGSNLTKALGPAALIAMAIEQVVKAFQLIDGSSGKVAKNMGISAESGRQLVSASADAAAMSGDLLVSTKDVVAAQMALNAQFGTSVEFAGKFAAEFASIQERTGLSSEAMGKFAEQALITGTNIEDQVSSVSAVTTEMSAQSGIMLNQKDIQEGLKDISDSQRLINKFNTKELAEQVFQTKLLGVSQSQLEKMGSSLLDFESSIAAEMEAELLTGKQLNLEGARQAALMGHQATLAAELRKEVGTSAEFGEMNVIQQEALAKAMGMSREEMASMLVEQEKLEAVKRAGFETTSAAQEAFNKLVEDGMTAEQAAAEMKKKGIDDAFAEQMKSTTQQEKLNAAMEKLTDLFVQIVDPLMPLVDALMGILQPIMSILSPIAKLIGDIVGLIMTYLNPLLKSLSTYFEGFNDVITGIFNLDFDMMIEGFKKIGRAIISFVVYPIDGAIELANLIPGVDIPLASTKLTGMVGLAEGGVVTKPTTALIGEGGEPEAVVPLSKAQSMGFGGSDEIKQTNALLKELILAVRQGGDVYIDGAKAGKSLTLATSKMG
jgi:phage-related protein